MPELKGCLMSTLNRLMEVFFKGAPPPCKEPMPSLTGSQRKLFQLRPVVPRIKKYSLGLFHLFSRHYESSCCPTGLNDKPLLPDLRSVDRICVEGIC